MGPLHMAKMYIWLEVGVEADIDIEFDLFCFVVSVNLRSLYRSAVSKCQAAVDNSKIRTKLTVPLIFSFIKLKPRCDAMKTDCKKPKDGSMWRPEGSAN